MGQLNQLSNQLCSLREQSWQSCGQFWFKTAAAWTDARNATFKEHIKTSPRQAMFREQNDVSRFRAFGCKAVVYLDNERRENGKHKARGMMQ
jgi:hypothetical protein